MAYFHAPPVAVLWYASIAMKNQYIPRQMEELLLKRVKQFPAVAVTGPRQCGKSTLLKELFSKTHAFVSFDDPLAREQAISDPKLFLENLGKKVVIDEIQYVPQLLSYVKIAIDRDRQRHGYFILTGSQQFTLIKNLGDSLAGRIALLDLLPFHFEEKRLISHLKKALSETQGTFLHACLRGSYPEIALDRTLDPSAWYGGYLRTYLERDVRTLYNIGSLRDFQLFMQLLASRTSQILNITSLSRDLGVGVNTIKRWISILEASRIISLLPPYHRNLGKRLTKAPKVYFLDCGLVCYLTGIQNRAHLMQGPMAGALFENFCIQETVKNFSFRGIRPLLFYFRSHNGLEVDLLIEKGLLQLFPIEIKLTKTPKPAMAESIHRFKRLFPKLEISSGRILCLNDENASLTREAQTQGLDDYDRWLRAEFPR